MYVALVPPCCYLGLLLPTSTLQFFLLILISKFINLRIFLSKVFKEDWLWVGLRFLRSLDFYSFMGHNRILIWLVIGLTWFTVCLNSVNYHKSILWSFRFRSLNQWKNFDRTLYRWKNRFWILFFEEK